MIKLCHTIVKVLWIHEPQAVNLLIDHKYNGSLINDKKDVIRLYLPAH